MSNLKEPKKITEPFGFVGGQMLTDILAKRPDAITDGEREILRARKSYLTDEQIRKFGIEEIEEEIELKPEIVPESESEPKVSKKERKGKK